jgi:hypothetical protein
MFEELISKMLYYGEKPADRDIRTIILKFRRQRFVILGILSLSLLATIAFGTLENPFHYTFSKIGNYFPYREWYILWAVVIGVSVHIASVCLFRLENYRHQYAYISIACATFFLIITALIPSVKEEMYFWHIVHKWTTFFYVMSMLVALHPFVLFLGRTKPRLWVILRNWELLILFGSMSSLIIQGKTGIFEIWFIIMTISLLIYLVLVLYRDKIEKLENRIE